MLVGVEFGANYLWRSTRSQVVLWLFSSLCATMTACTWKEASHAPRHSQGNPSLQRNSYKEKMGKQTSTRCKSDRNYIQHVLLLSFSKIFQVLKATMSSSAFTLKKNKPSYAVTECGSGAELASAERSQSDHPRAHLMASTWWGWLLPLSQKGLRRGEKGKERDGPEVYGSTHLQS